MEKKIVEKAKTFNYFVVEPEEEEEVLRNGNNYYGTAGDAESVLKTE